MNASDSDHQRTLPTRQEWDELYPSIQGEIIAVLKSRFGRKLQRDDHDDICQQVYQEIAERIAQGVPFVKMTLAATAKWLAKMRGVDCVRQRRERELFGAADDGADSRIPEPADPLGQTPSKEFFQRQDQQRKPPTLAGVIEEYCHHCEQQPRMLSGKEIFERMVRGQSADEIAAAMNMKKNAVQKAQMSALDRIVPLIQQFDRNGSVLTTLVDALGLNKQQGNRKPSNMGRYVQSFEEVKRYLFQESGAFCPLPQRLEQFADNSHADDLADIRYHIKAGCLLCDERLVELRDKA